MSEWVSNVETALEEHRTGAPREEGSGEKSDLPETVGGGPTESQRTEGGGVGWGECGQHSRQREPPVQRPYGRNRGGWYRDQKGHRG